MLLQDYKYDVFISWTGKDKPLKDEVKMLLTNAGLRCYDSEVECKGEFRSDYMYALQYSKVYILLMTDNLRNDPNVSGYGSFTEVRKEVSLAMELEAKGDLNVIIFNTSSFFCYKDVFRDVNDQVGWFFYVNTRGFSRIDALSGLDDGTAEKLLNDTKGFVQSRNENKPVISQRPHLGIENIPVTDCENFLGRDKEIEEIQTALANGTRAIVLSGMGGIGKTTIVKHFINACKNNGRYVCPQIVRIQNSENAQCSDIMGTVLSSVVFSDTQNYRGLNDTEKRQQQEKVLAELPDFVVLVVDNFSALTKEEINIILQKTNCKLLLTTRKHIDDLNYNEIKQIYVDKIEIDNAREIFNKISGGNVDVQSFEKFYNAVSGHTITLCMVATAMKMHKKSLEDMLDEVKSTGCWAENVNFKNSADNIEKSSVSEILEGLFNISGFENDENCKAILRSLSLIASGQMACDDICKILNLKNRNELIKLSEYNWITFDKNNEYVFLHPVLSQIANKVLKPSNENTKECIEFIVNQSQNRNDLTYGSLVFIRDGLFFAINRLAVNDGKLNHDLWSEYTEICRLLNDTTTVVSNSKILSGILSSKEEISKVNIFADLTTIEIFPSRIDIIMPYLEKIKDSNLDYKFVLQVLSIISPHLIFEKKDQFCDIIEHTLDSAIEKDDHFAVSQLTSYVLFFNPTSKLLAKIRGYVSKHRKSNLGVILIIEALLETYNMSKGNVMDFYKDFISGDFDFSKWKTPNRIKSRALLKKFEKVSKDDEFYFYAQNALSSGEKFAENDSLDPMVLYKMIDNFHSILLNNNLTLLNSFDVLNRTLSIIKHMPKSWQGELQQLVTTDFFDLKNFTVQQYLDYQLSYEINCLLGNSDALSQAQNMLLVEKKLHSDHNIHVVDAHIRLASCYAAFGENEKALEEYTTALNILRKTTEKSRKIFDICNALIIISNYLSDSDQATLNEWYELGIKNVKAYSEDALTFAYNYMSALTNLTELSDDNDILSEKIDELIFRKISSWVKEGNAFIISKILKYLVSLCNNMILDDEISVAKNILKRIEKLKQFAKSDLEIKRINLAYFGLNGFLYSQLCKFNKSNLWLDKALDYGCKKNINFLNLTAYALFLRFSNIKQDERIKKFLNDDTDCISAEKIFFDCFFSGVKINKNEKQLISNLFSVITTYDGYIYNEKGDDLLVLLKFGKKILDDSISQNFNITTKKFKYIKNAKKYKLAIIDMLWGEFSRKAESKWIKEYWYSKKDNSFCSLYFVNGEDSIFIKRFPPNEIEYQKSKAFLIETKSKIDKGFDSENDYAYYLIIFMYHIKLGKFVELEDYKDMLLRSFECYFIPLNEDKRKKIIDYITIQKLERITDTESDDFKAVKETLNMLNVWMNRYPYID